MSDTTVLNGHNGMVYGLALLPDGKTLATADDSESLRLWDLASQELLKKTRITWRCNCLCVLDDDKLLLAGHSSGVDVFAIGDDGRTLKKTKRSFPFGAHELRQHGELLLSLADGDTHLFDFKKKQPIKITKAHKGRATGLGVSPDGEQFATASKEEIRVRNFRDGKVLKRIPFKGKESADPVLAFLDANTLVTAGSDVVWWDIEKGKIVARKKVGSKSFEAECIDFHGDQLFVGGRNFSPMGSKPKLIHIFNIETHERIQQLGLMTKGAGAASLLYLPQHHVLVVGTMYGPVELLSL